MNENEFINDLLEKSEKDYGMCPPPINAQDGLNILINHFLGEDWYVTMPISQEQVNTEAIYTILKNNPRKNNIKKHKPKKDNFIKNNFLNNLFKRLFKRIKQYAKIKFI
jgi:hypothetical protein